MPLLLTAQANLSDLAVPRHRAASKVLLVSLLWVIVIALAFALDKPLALWLRNSGIAASIKNGGKLKELAKCAGYFWFPLMIVIALGIAHPLHWRATVFVSLCAIFAGSNSILKWAVGRSRPFKIPPFDGPHPFELQPFKGGWMGLFHQSSDLCFVSGHSALAFATAAGVAIVMPRARAIIVLLFTIATIVLLERVGENAHWLSDTVCGAALGMGGAVLLSKWCRGLLNVGNSLGE